MTASPKTSSPNVSSNAPARLDEIAARHTLERNTLEEGLASLAQAAANLGSNTLAVLVLESESVEIVYRRTQDGEASPPSTSILCGFAIRRALEDSQAVTAAHPVAKYLTSVVAPPSRSFLLFPWRARPAGVTIVFGFESCEPACPSTPCGLPAGLRESIGMASLATWSLNEVGRLREELRRANLTLAARKSVERAKGILQSAHGMSERQAYEYLRRTSRQRRIPILKVAQDLFRGDLFRGDLSCKDLVKDDLIGTALDP